MQGGTLPIQPVTVPGVGKVARRGETITKRRGYPAGRGLLPLPLTPVFGRGLYPLAKGGVSQET